MYSSFLCSALPLQLHSAGHMTDCEQGISLQYTHITYSSKSDALLPPFGQTRHLCCGTKGRVGAGSAVALGCEGPSNAACSFNSFCCCVHHK